MILDSFFPRQLILFNNDIFPFHTGLIVDIIHESYCIIFNENTVNKYKISTKYTKKYFLSNFRPIGVC